MRNRNLLLKIYLLILFFPFIVISSCKKNDEPPPAPEGPVTLIRTELTLGNLLAADTNIQAGDDSLLVYFYQQDTIYRFASNEFYSPYNFPVFKDSIKLELVDIPEFTFDFSFTLNDLLPLFDQDISDTLLQNDSTFHVFPAVQLNEGTERDNGPSEDYLAIAIKSGQIEIKVKNTLPVALENLHFSVLDIQYNSVLKEINLPQLDSNSTYTTIVSLLGKKFSNHFGVALNNFFSQGSDTNEVMINLSKGLEVSLKLKNVVAAGGISKVNAQLIGSKENWIDIITEKEERFFKSMYDSGTISLSVSGMNNANLFAYYILPSVTHNQSIMSDFVFAPNQQVSVKDTSRQGMNFDFTTHPGKHFNRLPIKIAVYLQASDSMIFIDTSDMAVIQLTFSDNPPFYNEGFYGKKTIHSAPFFVDVNPDIAGQESGNILFAEPSFIFNYYNNLNLPVKILPSLTAVNHSYPANVTLNTDSVNVLYPLIPGESAATEKIFDHSNSNIKDLFAIKPDQFIVNVDGRTNWNGQAENFSWDTCSFYGNLSLKIPLKLQSDFLTFSDTIHLNSNIQNEEEATGKLILIALNGFPFAMNLKLQLLNPNENEVVETIDFGNITSAEVDMNGKVSKAVETLFEIEAENSLIEALQKTKSAVIIMESDKIGNENGPVSLYSNYKTSINITFERRLK
jgi:hypothetical protein